MPQGQRDRRASRLGRLRVNGVRQAVSARLRAGTDGAQEPLETRGGVGNDGQDDSGGQGGNSIDIWRAPLIGALNGALNGPLYHPEPVFLPVMVLWPVPDLWGGQITSLLSLSFSTVSTCVISDIYLIPVA